MKRALIYFPTKQKAINYEGVRFRKTLKGACEIKNIPYTDLPRRKYDVANIVAVRSKEIALIHKLKRKKIPIIIWALRCENDPEVRMLERIDGSFQIKEDVKRVLNEASVVVAPSQAAAKFLSDHGVKKPIEIIKDAVNLERFDWTKTQEINLFYRYFKLQTDDKIIVSTGGIDEDSALDEVIKIARLVSNAQFFYFAVNDLKTGGKKALEQLRKEAPPNLTISELVPDDVYRSAIMNATIFLEPAKKYASTISLMDAMAAKTQIIIRHQAFYPDELINYDTCYVGANFEALATLIARYLSGKINDKCDLAYELVCERNLTKHGEEIVKLFEKL